LALRPAVSNADAAGVRLHAFVAAVSGFLKD